MAVNSLFDRTQFFVCPLSTHIQVVGPEKNTLKIQRLEGVLHEEQL